MRPAQLSLSGIGDTVLMCFLPAESFRILEAWICFSCERVISIYKYECSLSNCIVIENCGIAGFHSGSNENPLTIYKVIKLL